MDRRPQRPKLEAAEMLGISAASTHAGLQQDCFKELVNKIAWTLGSTYRSPYSGAKGAVRTYALKVATAIILDHGYPAKIGKDGSDLD